ncbi:MAG: stalk domain-containing protein [Defluviitaleaceae bacterium]|nr:stalk domain-containing protein [Defluviitaleaceae bacterium]
MKNGKIKERFKGALVGIILTFVVTTSLPVFARVAQETITVNFNNIRIAVNGQHVQTEFEPFVFQGRTYLPVRDVANAMGFDVTWEDATNTVHLTERNNLNVVPDYPAHQPAQPPQETPPSPQPTPNHSASGRNNRPSNPAISLERAIEIAYEDLARRGITATYRSNSGMDWERGQWVWELLFRTQGERMPFIEFYINVDNGNIVKFEWDD